MIRGGKSSLAALAECPKAVEVVLPMVNGDGSTTSRTMSVLFSSCGREAPRVALTAENLAFIVRTIRAEPQGEDVERGRKRHRDARESWDYPEIKDRVGQSAAMIAFRNADGKLKYRQVSIQAYG